MDPDARGWLTRWGRGGAGLRLRLPLRDRVWLWPSGRSVCPRVTVPGRLCAAVCARGSRRECERLAVGAPSLCARPQLWLGVTAGGRAGVERGVWRAGDLRAAV